MQLNSIFKSINNGIEALSFYNFPVTVNNKVTGRMIDPTLESGFIKVDVNVFPNPAEEFIVLSSQKSISEFSLIDSRGFIVLSNKTPFEGDLKIDLSSYASGIYTLIIRSEGNSISKKISIIH